jgi:hypothetical protein
VIENLHQIGTRAEETGRPMVILFKLKNMQDCIGQLISDEEVFVTFAKLRVLQYQQVGQEIRIGFVNFMIPAEDANIALPKVEILCHMEAPSKIAEGYMQAVSPIQLAKTLPIDNRKFLEIKPN